MTAKTIQIYNLFKSNFPYIIRSENTVKSIIGNSSNIIIERREGGKLIACAVINKNSILLFCVDEPYRNKGLGSELLKECEKTIKDNGYDSVILGVGFDYLMPGVPTSKRYADYVNENLFPELTSNASDFFEKRGYEHSWGKCNCFDMFMPLSKKIDIEGCVGDLVNGILYRWAEKSDLPAIVECVDDACQFMDESFSVFYKNDDLYKTDSSEKVLIACKDKFVVGALIVSVGIEREDVGSVGCTSVRSTEAHQGIGTNLIKLGTKYLQSTGIKNAFLGYTYTGLDKMYGLSGYEICIYYFKGVKKL